MTSRVFGVDDGDAHPHDGGDVSGDMPFVRRVHGVSIRDHAARHAVGGDDEITELGTHAARHASGGGDAVDHGGLGGLSDDDHTQYLLRSELVWQDWSPSFTNLSTVGGSTVTARYMQIGKVVHCRFHIVLGTTPTVGDVRVSLPVTAATTGLTALTSPLGTASFLEVGVANNAGFVLFATSTTVAVRTFTTATSPDLRMAALSASVPFTWAAVDEMHASWTYEAA